HAALLHAGRLVGSLELDRHLRLDLLVQPHLETVEVKHIAADGMVLLLLDHNRDGLGALELEVEQGGALEEHRAKLTRRNLEGARLVALAVDDAGDETLATQASRGPRSEDVAG